MSTIEGKVVAITGASSGIGEAAARLLAERGAKVVVGARRSERLEKLVAAIQAKKGESRFRTLDVTSHEDMKAFMDFSKAEFGRVDVLVNNAGIMPLSPMTALKIDEWDRMIDVNIRGSIQGRISIATSRALRPSAEGLLCVQRVMRFLTDARVTCASWASEWYRCPFVALNGLKPHVVSLKFAMPTFPITQRHR